MKRKSVLWFNLLLCCSIGLCGITSCDEEEKDDLITPPSTDEPDDPSVSSFYYVLNQGVWGQNNASLTRFSSKDSTVVADIFEQANGRKLGDNAQDMKVYGSKLWISINGENTLEVVSATDAKSVKQIKIEQPRYIEFAGGYAYVTRYDGYLARIDTATFAMDSVYSGPNPEELAILDGKIYVANSGGYMAPDYNNTVSVFSLPMFTKEKELEVAVNPAKIRWSGKSELLVYSNGNYADAPSSLQKLNTITGNIEAVDLDVYNFSVKGDSLYYYSMDWSSPVTTVGIYNLATRTVETTNFTADSVCYKNAYGLNVLSDNTIGVLDAISYDGVEGKAYIFSEDGQTLHMFDTGVNPCVILEVK